MSSDEDDILNNAMFQEPDDYFQPEKPHTYTSFTLLSGQKIHLRLVGHNPLWAHHLWNGSQVLSTYLQQHASSLIRGKTVLELGAGAGLPSIVSAILGAKRVVTTDYPDVELIENLAWNIDASSVLLPQPSSTNVIIPEGYLWGSSTSKILSHIILPSPSPSQQQEQQEQQTGFDTLLLADLLFNHSCHDALVSTIRQTLSRTSAARALVFFTPYRPWLLANDMAFFDLCKGKGLEVEKVVEEVMDKVMFEEDRGDEMLRRTVFGYEMRWRDLIIA